MPRGSAILGATAGNCQWLNNEIHLYRKVVVVVRVRNLWTKPGFVGPTRAAAKEKVAENLWATPVLAERSLAGAPDSPPFPLPETHRFLSIGVSIAAARSGSGSLGLGLGAVPAAAFVTTL